MSHKKNATKQARMQNIYFGEHLFIFYKHITYVQYDKVCELTLILFHQY